jgi:hypothetical protein
VIRRSRDFLAALLLIAACALAVAGSASASAAAPAWRVSSHAAPTNLVPGLTDGRDMFLVSVVNTGAAPTDGSTVTVTDDLPPGFTAIPAATYPSLMSLRLEIVGDRNGATPYYTCTTGSQVVCTFDETVQPSERVTVQIPVEAPASGPSAVTNHVSVSGGGASGTAESTDEAPFDAAPAPFGIQLLSTWLTDRDGSAVTQAGAHPSSFRVRIGVNTNLETRHPVGVSESLKSVNAVLPAGLVVNPSATPRCSEAEFETVTCPDDTAVGITNYTLTRFAFPAQAGSAVLYNVEPPPGSPASFAFEPLGLGFFFHILGGIDPGSNYSLSAHTNDIMEFGGAAEVSVDLWGDPSDPGRDFARGSCVNTFKEGQPCPVPADPTPVLDMPTACSSSLETSVTATSWQDENPGGPVTRSTDVTDAEANPTGVTNCESLEFNPTLKARPTTNVADSPSGLEVDLHVPQSNSQDTLAVSHLKGAVVTLPEGIALNPAAANGLSACTAAQIGLASTEPIRFDGEEPSCPDASKLGTLEVSTPLLEDPLPGSIYLAKPYDNPFDSLLAIYLVVNDPQSGALIKLAGHVETDPNTGQLTTTFDENPQLPFEDFKLDFFGGSRGALRTPPTCGEYSTVSQLTPWSGTEPVTTHDDYEISQGPGGSCATKASQQPFSPSFDAGTIAPIAGAHSPFVVHLRRNDGTQGFSSVTVSPPQGLVGKLAGIEQCSDGALSGAAAKSGTEEQAHPSCPQGSEVGSVVAGAGAGPAPYYAPAKVYLAGPYKGAPLSFAIITPAVAGPFDLGTVVTRVAVHVDPATAKITTESDPIPASLKGIPLDVRTIDLSLDRQGFTQNGTSCDPSSVDGQSTSLLGVSIPLSVRFQLAECEALAFKPKMTLDLKGPVKRGRYPKLTAVLTMPEGDANIASVSVALPHSEFLAQEHIRTICTRVQFAADQCPAGAVYGQASVQTPLLDYPLSGNVYLRASDNKLPDLVPDLRGPAYQPLRLEAAGRTDSINGGLRNSFEFIPDAPFSKFTLQLQGSTKGLLQNSTNICASPQRATVKYAAHNGDTYVEHPLLKASCPPKHKKKHGSRHQKAHRRAAG